MSTLTIQNVDPVTHDKVRLQAARNGRSVEAEVRHIVANAVSAPTHDLLLTLHAAAGEDGTSLALPERSDGSREVLLP